MIVVSGSVVEGSFGLLIKREFDSRFGDAFD